jgi:putative addiction module component (TIGR02574 family)
MSALDIQKMSVQDRLEIMEAIWESFSYERREIDSPDWHRDILENRKEKLNSPNTEFVTIETLKEQKHQ